jgi:probable non-F420 flavinoid oxidoreductase
VQTGYHASHEQFGPAELLTFAQHAEEAGFGAISSSDHLAPFSERQGSAGFAWSWLGSAMALTTLPYGVVSAPGQRYHPAVLAQAIATVAQMWPGRLTVALGSGQALNEHVTGDVWPRKPVRNARLRECAAILRSLLAGETVDADGLVRVRAARLYSLPEVTPALFAAALSPATAREVGAWADGLITVHSPALPDVIEAFRAGGGEGKPIHVQVHLSWAEDRETVERQALDQWRINALPPMLNEELELPEQFDAASEHLPASALADSVVMSEDLGRHAEVLAACADLGVERVYLHQVGRDQAGFLDAFGAKVLPQL